MNTLKSQGYKISAETIDNYITLMCKSFLLYSCERYDIRGKDILRTNGKLYMADLRLRNQIVGYKTGNIGHQIENLVYLELLRQGYEVYVGVLYEKKIDFVAMKRNEKIYIQVSDNIGNDFENDTFKREVAPLLQIKDAYPKMVIARTGHDDYQYEGIQIVDIANWLVRNN